MKTKMSLQHEFKKKPAGEFIWFLVRFGKNKPGKKKKPKHSYIIQLAFGLFWVSGIGHQFIFLYFCLQKEPIWRTNVYVYICERRGPSSRVIDLTHRKWQVDKSMKQKGAGETQMEYLPVKCSGAEQWCTREWKLVIWVVHSEFIKAK